MKARKSYLRGTPAVTPQSAALPLVPWYRTVPFALLALTALSLAAYSNSFDDGFALDWAPILQDARIQAVNATNLRDILWHTYFWPHGEAGIYRPLTTLSWLFNYTILGNGVNPAGYHWVNWLLHAANGLLVFSVVRRVTGSVGTSLLTAGLWAVHPVLTEAVTNAGGRADLIGGMAVLSGFLLYLVSRDAAGGRRAGLLALLALVAAAGAASKESAVILPAVIVLYEIVLYEVVWWDSARRRRFLPGFLTASVPVGAVLLLRYAVLNASLPAEFPFVDNPITGAGFWQGRLTALTVLARYLWLTIWPVRLSSDYSYSQIPLATGGARDWIAAGTVTAAILAAGMAFRRNRMVFFFAAFALLSLLPASNLLFPAGTIMAERLLYLPSVGLVAIFVLAIEKLPMRLAYPPVSALAICGLLATGYCTRTWIRNRDWKDDYTMAVATVKTSPDSFKVHRLLADYLLKTGPSPANLDLIVAEADRAIAILDKLPDERSVNGPWNVAAGARLAKAELCAQSAPDQDVRSLDNCSADYLRAAQFALRSTQIESAARAAWNRRRGTTLTAAPTAAEGYRILASAHLGLGRAAEALTEATEARAIDPLNPEAYAEIARAEVLLNRGEEAAIALVEGMSVTGNSVLRENLLELYRGGVDRDGCAIVAGAQGPALNPSCAIVRRNFCAAAARVNRRDIQEQFRCAANP